MQNTVSKVNTFLLVVLIVLVGIAIYMLARNNQQPQPVNLISPAHPMAPINPLDTSAPSASSADTASVSTSGTTQ